MNDLNSHGQGDLRPAAVKGRVEHAQGAAGFPWQAQGSEHLTRHGRFLGVKGAVAFVQRLC